MIKKIFSIVQQNLAKFDLTLTRRMVSLGRERGINLNQNPDFVRLSSLELVAAEINSKNINGNIAELGVYQGNFASAINKCFSDRKFYLFDTFEGFDKKTLRLTLRWAIQQEIKIFQKPL